MSDKMTLEEMEAKRQELFEAYQNISKNIEDKRKAEEDKRKKQLALEKQKRTEEIDEAENKYKELVKKFIEDYGSYKKTVSSNDADLGYYSHWPWIF